MRIHLLKLTIILSLVTLFAIYSLNGSAVRAFSAGPDPSLTGAPGESTCSSCHGGGPSGGTLSISGLPANYSPNQEVTLTVTLSQANRAHYGFQLTAIDDSGKKAGDLTPSDNRTQIQSGTVDGNLRQYINHTLAGFTPVTPGQGSWAFKWKAPAQSVGRVTFYVAGNAANGDGGSFGDSIYTTSQSIQPGSTLGPLVNVSAASFVDGPPLTAGGIVAGFGGNLSQNVVLAPGVPLPTNLDGTSIVVRDSAGVDRDAGLFVVTPGQVNYLIPPGTANGAATITARRNGTPMAQGTTTIDTVSPSLFSANSNGRGVASAYVLRRRFLTPTMFVDTNEQIIQLNQTTNQFEPLMIDLGPDLG